MRSAASVEPKKLAGLLKRGTLPEGISIRKRGIFMDCRRPGTSRIFCSRGNNAHKIIVTGQVNVSGPGVTDPVYAKAKDIPFLEYVENKLKALLLDIPSFPAKHFNYVVTGMREHLSAPDREFAFPISKKELFPTPVPFEDIPDPLYSDTISARSSIGPLSSPQSVQEPEEK